MGEQLRRFYKDQSGATALEYCFVASLVAMAIVGGLTSVGGKLSRIFTQLAAVN